LDADGSTAVATVDGTEFEDLPPLLEACAGDASRISPGRAAELDDAGLLRPLGAPSKIVCIGLNYRKHAEESGAPLPKFPMLFSKLSMRDFQNHTTQFLAGKTWERSTPLGPAVIPAGELGGASPDLAISGSLNGSTVQNSRTSDLIFSIPQLVEYMTTIMTMEPGDVVLTGTPANSRPMEPGDVVEVEVTGVGRLLNTVQDVPAPAHAVGHQPTDSDAVRRVALGQFPARAPASV